MPKATLSYTLPAEQEEFEAANNGWRFKAALQDVAQAFRNKAKYGDEKDSYVTWDDAKQLFWNTLQECGVDLD